MSVPSGRMLGRYRLEASLGKGGMAEVFRATDTRLGRTVAVKVILPLYSAEREFMGRFRLEARLVASLEHPNVLPVYDFGEEDGLPFLVMPFMAGGTLADRLLTGAVPVAQALRWIDGLAGALDTAHRAGILHRDVKPQNVLLGAGDRALLADFGIAKMGEGATRLTSTGVVVGTPHYMAPELARGGSATASTDLYALAVLAFELLTGVPPFDGESALAVLHQHVHTPPPRPTSKAIHLPRGLDAVFERGLSKNPAERPRNGAEFAAELLRSTGPFVAGVAAGTATEAATVAALPTARTAPLRSATTRARPTAMPAPLEGTKSGRGAWGALAAAGVAGLLVWYAVSSWSPEAAPPSPEEGEPSRVAENPAPPAPPAAEPSLPAPDASLGAEAGAASPVSRTPAPPARATLSTAEAGSNSAAAPEAGFEVAPDVAIAAEGAADEWPLAARLRRPAGTLAGGAMRRLTRADFESLAHSTIDPARGRPGLLDVAQAYGRGGLAYLDGSNEQAESALRAVLSTSASIPFLDSGLAAMLRAAAAQSLQPWHVALGYTDPKREAAALLATVRAERPNDVSALIGEAVVSHLNGDHRGAAAQGEQAHRLEPRVRLALFVAQESVLAGDRERALQWYESAAGGVGMEAALAAYQGARVARELGQGPRSVGLMKKACDNGLRAACSQRPGPRRGRLPGGR